MELVVPQPSPLCQTLSFGIRTWEKLEDSAQQLVADANEEVLQPRRPRARHEVRTLLQALDRLAGLQGPRRLTERHVRHARQELREGEDRPREVDLVGAEHGRGLDGQRGVAVALSQDDRPGDLLELLPGL